MLILQGCAHAVISHQLRTPIRTRQVQRLDPLIDWEREARAEIEQLRATLFQDQASLALARRYAGLEWTAGMWAGGGAGLRGEDQPHCLLNWCSSPFGIIHSLLDHFPAHFPWRQ